VKYGDLLKEAARGGPPLPPRVIELPVSAWSADRPDRPMSPVSIGLRVPSDDDTEAAKDEAMQRVALLPSGVDPSDRIDAFNDALVANLVAAATCIPTDVTQRFFGMGEDEISIRLTTDGIKRLWQEIEMLRTAENPGMPEAGDEEFSHLIALWERDAVTLLPPEEAKQCRRLVEHVRQRLAEAEVRFQEGR
jgi:hypothetical protein